MHIFNAADGMIGLAFAVVFIELLWPAKQKPIPEPWWHEEEDRDGR